MKLLSMSMSATMSNSYSKPSRWMGASPTLRGVVFPVLSSFSTTYSVLARMVTIRWHLQRTIASTSALCMGVTSRHAAKVLVVCMRRATLSTCSKAPSLRAHARLMLSFRSASLQEAPAAVLAFTPAAGVHGDLFWAAASSSLASRDEELVYVSKWKLRPRGAASLFAIGKDVYG